MRFKVTYFGVAVRPSDRPVYMEVANMDALRKRIAASTAFRTKGAALVEIMLDDMPFWIAHMFYSEERGFHWHPVPDESRENLRDIPIDPKTGKLARRRRSWHTSSRSSSPPARSPAHTRP